MGLRIKISAKPYHTDLEKAALKMGGPHTLAKHLDVSYAVLYSWLAFKGHPPIDPRDLSRQPWWSAERVADVGKKLFRLTGKTLDELFPPILRQNKRWLAKNEWEAPNQRRAAESLPSYYEKQKAERLPLDLRTSTRMEDLIEQLEIALHADKMRDRDRQVLMLRFGLDKGPGRTFKEVSFVLGVSPARANQLVKHALHKIRFNRDVSRKLRELIGPDLELLSEPVERSLQEIYGSSMDKVQQHRRARACRAA